MFNYQSSALASEVQRLINQLQQNERNNANTLRSLASQLQNLAATEAQATAMLQQLYSLTNQLTFEAARVNQFSSIPQAPIPQTATPGYETVRSSVNPNSSSGSTSANVPNSLTSSGSTVNPSGMVNPQHFNQG